MLVGSVGCGKTTFRQKSQSATIQYQKTQAIEYHDSIIDTPGEFTQMRHYLHALIVTAADVDIIGLMQSATEQKQIYPHLFSSYFTKPTIGIITKIDLAKTDADIATVEKMLRAAGASLIFKVSSTSGVGITDLTDYLQSDS